MTLLQPKNKELKKEKNEKKEEAKEREKEREKEQKMIWIENETLVSHAIPSKLMFSQNGS